MVVRIVETVGRQRREVHAIGRNIHIKAALGVAQVIHALDHALQLLKILLTQQLIERILNISGKLIAVGVLILLLKLVIRIQHVLILIRERLKVGDLAIDLLSIGVVALDVHGHRCRLIGKAIRGIVQRVAQILQTLGSRSLVGVNVIGIIDASGVPVLFIRQSARALDRIIG